MDRLFGDLPFCLMNDFDYTREEVQAILKNLIAASGCRDAACRMFATGSYVTQKGENIKSQFYAQVIDGVPKKPLDGIKEL